MCKGGLSNSKTAPKNNIVLGIINRMKKINSIFLFAFVSIALLNMVSCSKKDDGSTAVANASIVGKWKSVSATKNGVAVVFSPNPCPTNNNYTEFFVNNTVTSSGLRSSGSLCVPYSTSSSYDIQGDLLIVSTNGSDPVTTKSRIISITETTAITKQIYDKHLSGNPPVFVEIFIPESEQITYTAQRIN